MAQLAGKVSLQDRRVPFLMPQSGTDSLDKPMSLRKRVWVAWGGGKEIATGLGSGGERTKAQEAGCWVHVLTQSLTCCKSLQFRLPRSLALSPLNFSNSNNRQ